MPVETRLSASLKSKSEPNTENDLRPFICSCGKSARFVPLYQFNTSGVMSQIVLGKGRPAIWCPECHQMWQWAPPTVKGAHDGGWENVSFLEDLERVIAPTS